MTWRTATTTADTSGATLFQTAWTNSQGEIQSFDGTSGENKIEKYWNPSLLATIYKKIIPGVWGFQISTSNFFESDDGSNFTSITESGGPSTFLHTPLKSTTKWWSTGYYLGNYYVTSSPDKINWTREFTILQQSMDVRGNNLVVLSSNEGKFHYSINDGASWTESASLGAIAFSAICLFADGKVGLIYAEDIGGGEYQPKLKILANFSDTTGTNYNIGSSFVGSNIISSRNWLGCDGTTAYCTIADEGSYASMLYKFNSSGTITLVTSSTANFNENFILTYRGNNVFAFDIYSNSFLMSNLYLNPPTAEYGSYFTSLPWWVGEKMFIGWFDTGLNQYGTYSSLDNGTSWTLETTSGITDGATYLFVSDV